MINISVGKEDFYKLRKENCYYVDKTPFIEEFLYPTPAEVSLITRPRRF